MNERHERAVQCPCTTFEQDEDCPVGQPSLLCSACDGKGVTSIEMIVSLAAEMLKVAEQVDELEDPFAAWESIELLKSAAPPAAVQEPVAVKVTSEMLNAFWSKVEVQQTRAIWGLEEGLTAALALLPGEPKLYGPYGYLNGNRALSEDEWSLDNDPIENNDEYFSIPLFAKIDISYPVSAAPSPPAAVQEPVAVKVLDDLLLIPKDLTDEEWREIKYNVDRKANPDIPLWRIQETVKYATFIAGHRGRAMLDAALSPSQSDPAPEIAALRAALREVIEYDRLCQEKLHSPSLNAEIRDLIEGLLK